MLIGFAALPCDWSQYFLETSLRSHGENETWLWCGGRLHHQWDNIGASIPIFCKAAVWETHCWHYL